MSTDKTIRLQREIKRLEADLATVTANLKEMTGYRDKWKADCITTENKLIALKKSIKQALEE